MFLAWCCFFFSSRRRHTRLVSDWSSDVCSSDLYAQARVMERSCVQCHSAHDQSPRKDWKVGDVRGVLEIIRPLDRDERSEERRVGKECRYRWARDACNKKGKGTRDTRAQ